MSAGSSFSASALRVAAEVDRLERAVVHPADVDAALLAKLGAPLSRETHAFDLLRRPELSYDDLTCVAAADGSPSLVRR